MISISSYPYYFNTFRFCLRSITLFDKEVSKSIAIAVIAIVFFFAIALLSLRGKKYYQDTNSIKNFFSYNDIKVACSFRLLCPIPLLPPRWYSFCVVFSPRIDLYRRTSWLPKRYKLRQWWFFHWLRLCSWGNELWNLCDSEHLSWWNLCSVRWCVWGTWKVFCELYVGRGLFFFNGLAEAECESFVPVVTNNY